MGRRWIPQVWSFVAILPQADRKELRKALRLLAEDRCKLFRKFMNNEVIKALQVRSSLQQPDLRKLILKFFQELGFKDIREDNSNILIKRGSEFKNGFTFNPLKWKSDIRIFFLEIGVGIVVDGEFKINTKNQMVSEKEALIWEQLFQNFELVVKTGKKELAVFNENIKTVRRAGLNIMMWLILGFVVSLPVGIYFSVRFESFLFFSNNICWCEFWGFLDRNKEY